MSKRPGYIGGYIAPDLKNQFVERALELRITNTDYLEDILIREMEGKISNATEDRGGVLVEDDFSLFEMLGEASFWHLNQFVMVASETFDKDDPQYLPSTLVTLAELLLDDADQPIEAHGEDRDFEEHLPADLVEEINTYAEIAWLRTAGDFSKTAFYTLLAERLESRADTLAVENDPGIQIQLEPHVMEQVEVFLKEINEEGSTHFESIADFLSHKLGESLVEAGDGFFAPRNKAMLEVGKEMVIK